jgi:hypothetical protein
MEAAAEAAVEAATVEAATEATVEAATVSKRVHFAAIRFF